MRSASYEIIFYSCLVDPASRYTLASKPKPCMPKSSSTLALYSFMGFVLGETADGSLNQSLSEGARFTFWITVANLELIHAIISRAI